MTTADGVSDDYPGVVELRDHLLKCSSAGISTHLSSDLVEVALEVLHASSGSGFYRIEKVASDGTVEGLAVVGPLCVRGAHQAATELYPDDKVQIRRGSRVLSLNDLPLV
jgi:hypothetical protein